MPKITNQNKKKLKNKKMPKKIYTNVTKNQNKRIPNKKKEKYENEKCNINQM